MLDADFREFRQGLRTLVLAQRELSPDQWAAWNRAHTAASTALAERESALAQVAEEIERVCVYVCVSMYVCRYVCWC